MRASFAAGDGALPVLSANRRRSVQRIVLGVLGAAGTVTVVAGCGGEERPERLAFTEQLSDIEATGDGGVIVAERATGRLLTVDVNGRKEELARVAVVAEPGQRGLLGVVTDDRATYAAYTRAGDGRLVVADVAEGGVRIVWLGPASADVANGGRLALVEDGLVIGVGDLTEPALVADPGSPNGKLLLLDPSGPPSQVPEVISSGWNNPFAFTAVEDGSIRVADNAPGDLPERLARGDAGRPVEVVELEGTAAPAGVVADGDNLLVCGYVSRELRRYRPGSSDYEVVTEGCRFDVARLSDGRLALADDRGIVVIEDP